ncbi:MAG: glycosyl transferase [Lachnospiraceae bacterium]|nr:glycosyl transferase [Lachnospiraceae bacterium]
MSIPRIIHYCWLSDDPVPEMMKRCVEGWKKILPDYEFVKWDLARFDADSSVWVREALERKKYAFASDYIRIWAVYHCGGIYLDMDMEVLKPFDELLDAPYMLAYESPDEKRIEAGCFGAEKNAPFLKACLDHYAGKHFVRYNGTMDLRPLSKRMSDIIRENDLHLKISSWDYFTAKSFETGIETPGENTYAIHHFAGSWKSKEERRIIRNARRIRKAHPHVGKYAAFAYEKTIKAMSLVRTGGIKVLCYRIREYMRGQS